MEEMYKKFNKDIPEEEVRIARAFDEFHQSILSKGSDFHNKPLKEVPEDVARECTGYIDMFLEEVSTGDVLAAVREFLERVGKVKKSEGVECYERTAYTVRGKERFAMDRCPSYFEFSQGTIYASNGEFAIQAIVNCVAMDKDLVSRFSSILSLDIPCPIRDIMWAVTADAVVTGASMCCCSVYSFSLPRCISHVSTFPLHDVGCVVDESSVSFVFTMYNLVCKKCNMVSVIGDGMDMLGYEKRRDMIQQMCDVLSKKEYAEDVNALCRVVVDLLRVPLSMSRMRKSDEMREGLEDVLKDARTVVREGRKNGVEWVVRKEYVPVVDAMGVTVMVPNHITIEAVGLPKRKVAVAVSTARHMLRGNRVDGCVTVRVNCVVFGIKELYMMRTRDQDVPREAGSIVSLADDMCSGGDAMSLESILRCEA